LVRAEAVFREPPVPFCPRSGLGIGEVQRFNNASSLPATVSRMWRTIEDASAVRDVSPPDSSDGNGVNIDRHRSARGRGLNSSYDA
jgi:hypothetical protein